MKELDAKIKILDGYKNDLQWSIWYVEAAEHVQDKERKIKTIREIIKDISNEVVMLKGKRWKMNELKNKED